MDKTITFSRTVEIRHDVDVFIAGGGPAGFAAAMAAARHGARVFLAEAGGAFGGMGTLGLVPAFMPLGDGEHLLAAGIGTEVLRRMLSPSETDWDPDLPLDTRFEYAVDVEKLKRVYDTMAEEAGIAFSFGAHLVGAEVADGRVAAAILWGKSGFYAVRAKVFVDATGDGDLCAFAGAPFSQGDDTGACMPGTLCSVWGGIDWKRALDDGLRWGHNRHVERAYADGVFHDLDLHVSGFWPKGDGFYCGGNVGHAFGLDATDERSVTRAFVDGRRRALEYRRYYREYMRSGFSDIELLATADTMGVRESRRIHGDYVMTLDDFVSRRRHPDDIALNNYPVDIHVMRPNDPGAFDRFTRDFTSLRYKKLEHYGIPYRALLPQGISNALVAGRCISCDRSIQASIRVMPCCFETGQAAGLAAALAAERECAPRALPVHDLQDALRALGAYLPQDGGGD
jgi:hypothetical protein